MDKDKQAFKLEYGKDEMFLLGGNEVGTETVIDGWNSLSETISNQAAEIDRLKDEIERKDAALKWVLKTQKRFYGDATGLHIEMIDAPKIIVQALTGHKEVE